MARICFPLAHWCVLGKSFGPEGFLFPGEKTTIHHVPIPGIFLLPRVKRWTPRLTFPRWIFCFLATRAGSVMRRNTSQSLKGKFKRCFSIPRFCHVNHVAYCHCQSSPHLASMTLFSSNHKSKLGTFPVLGSSFPFSFPNSPFAFCWSWLGGDVHPLHRLGVTQSREKRNQISKMTQ
jgi:hypothetical protein